MWGVLLEQAASVRVSERLDLGDGKHAAAMEWVRKAVRFPGETVQSTVTVTFFELKSFPFFPSALDEGAL